jgi:hypothetical protein
VKDFERYAQRITEQIFDGDNAFFLESGVDMESAVAFEPHGAYGGIRYRSEPTAFSSKITELEIVLEASDLYTVIVTFATPEDPGVIELRTGKPVRKELEKCRVERVFAFELVEVLHSLFYRGGNR